MAAGSTYTPIATTTLGSAATGYTFSSIPSTYTDLVLIASINYGTLDSVRLQFNGDSSALYSQTTIRGDGSSATSYRNTGQTKIESYAASSNSGVFSSSIIHINNYANTSTYKTVLFRQNNPLASSNQQVEQTVGLYRSTSAISSIYVFSGVSSNMSIGTTLTLYGIAAA